MLGMLMGFVSYASIVSPETLEQTIKDIRKNSHAKTDFEKAQEEVSKIAEGRARQASHSLLTPLGLDNHKTALRPYFCKPPNILLPRHPRRLSRLRPDQILRQTPRRQMPALPLHLP